MTQYSRIWFSTSEQGNIQMDMFVSWNVLFYLLNDFYLKNGGLTNGVFYADV